MSLSENNTEYLTIQKAANFLGVSEKTIRNYIEAGKLKEFQRFNRHYVLQSEVRALNEITPVENENQGS